MARASLLLFSMPWLHAGCVVPEPEKFREPERTAIVVDTVGVDPPITRMIVDQGRFDQNFTIPFRSEDVGDPPAAFLYLDFGTPQELNIGQNLFGLAPSTFDDASRSFGFRVGVDVPACAVPEGLEQEDLACCHQVMLRATHRSNVIDEAGIQRPDPIRSLGDLTIVVWWLALAPVGATPDVLSECPTSTTGTP